MHARRTVLMTLVLMDWLLGVNTYGAAFYSIQDLGVEGRVATGAEINNRGHVLFGLQSDVPSGVSTLFLYDGHSVFDLTDTFDSGVGLNDAGTMVGVKFLGSVGGVVRYTPSAFHGPPDGVLALIQGSGSNVVDLNNHGAFVGWRGPVSERKAFLSTADGEITDLGTLGGNLSLAHAVNELGQVTGFSTTGANPQEIGAGAAAEEAFLFENGAMIGLGTLGGPTSIGRAINELGQIVGDSSLPNHEFHAFLYDPIDGMQDIGVPGSYSVAYDINDLGLVVGQEYDPLGINPPKAFLFDQTYGTRYLDDLVGKNSVWSSFLSATSINNRGQIVGTGLVNGEVHIFLLTPTPEPTAFLLTVIAVASLGMLRHRCRLSETGKRGQL